MKQNETVTKLPNKQVAPNQRKQPKRATSDFDTILTLLPRLSAQEIRELRLLLDNYHVAPEDRPREEVDWLFDGVRAELQRRGLGCPPLTAKFIRSVAPEAPAEAARVRETLLESWRRSERDGQPSVTQWLALGRLCAQTLARLVESWTVKDDNTTRGRKSVHVSAATMLRHLWRVPEALDASFPGYLAAGILWITVRERDPNVLPNRDPEAQSSDVHHDEYADDGADDDEDEEAQREAAFERATTEYERREAERALARGWNEKLLKGRNPS